MNGSDVSKQMSLSQLVANLEAIATAEDIQIVKQYLDLGLGIVPATDTAQRARERTAHYKLRKLLQREPSSQHILQATAYAVLSLKEAGPVALEAIIMETLETLVAAGFDKGRSSKALKRFVTGIDTRKSTWIARSRARMQLAIVKAVTSIRAGALTK